MSKAASFSKKRLTGKGYCCLFIYKKCIEKNGMF